MCKSVILFKRLSIFIHIKVEVVGNNQNNDRLNVIISLFKKLLQLPFLQ